MLRKETVLREQGGIIKFIEETKVAVRPRCDGRRADSVAGSRRRGNKLLECNEAREVLAELDRSRCTDTERRRAAAV
ncbi:hypothetical protein EYF80_049449 [Liparis tanakae]|uniref:Uncharacterized protein n=1 Tax=Liparis tanakae TaxID=230148 RepID=A0A4Z2FHI9_9TELE|nr:hypothetical protein EYF80_049449 [Liparis tanakae]